MSKISKISNNNIQTTPSKIFAKIVLLIAIPPLRTLNMALPLPQPYTYSIFFDNLYEVGER